MTAFQATCREVAPLPRPNRQPEYVRAIYVAEGTGQILTPVERKLWEKCQPDQHPEFILICGFCHSDFVPLGEEGPDVCFECGAKRLDV